MEIGLYVITKLIIVLIECAHINVVGRIKPKYYKFKTT